MSEKRTNGKGDKSRITDIKKYKDNFDDISWSKHKRVVPLTQSAGVIENSIPESERCEQCAGDGWYAEQVCSSLPWESEQKQCEFCNGEGRVASKFPTTEATGNLSSLYAIIDSAIASSKNPILIDTIGNSDIRTLKRVRHGVIEWLKATEYCEKYY